MRFALKISVCTVLIVAVLFAAGYFIGSSKDKAESVRKTINKIFPPKSE